MNIKSVMSFTTSDLVDLAKIRVVKELEKRGRWIQSTEITIKFDTDSSAPHAVAEWNPSNEKEVREN